MISEIRETIARAIHESYRKSRARDTAGDDLSLSEWEELSESLKESNRQQADDIVRKLESIGCYVDKVHDRTIDQMRFTGDEIETMAEMEHERWNVERFRDGWKLGKAKDVRRKISPYLVDWKDLPEEAKEWDRETVRKIPEFLAKVGLEIEREYGPPWLPQELEEG
jgi:hypothetical protein